MPTQRQNLWRLALEWLGQSPIWGLGPGGFMERFNRRDEMMKARVESMEAVKPSLQALYAALTMNAEEGRKRMRTLRRQVLEVAEITGMPITGMTPSSRSRPASAMYGARIRFT